MLTRTVISTVILMAAIVFIPLGGISMSYASSGDDNHLSANDPIYSSIGYLNKEIQQARTLTDKYLSNKDRVENKIEAAGKDVSRKVQAQVVDKPKPELKKKASSGSGASKAKGAVSIATQTKIGDGNIIRTYKEGDKYYFDIISGADNKTVLAAKQEINADGKTHSVTYLLGRADDGTPIQSAIDVKAEYLQSRGSIALILGGGDTASTVEVINSEGYMTNHFSFDSNTYAISIAELDGGDIRVSLLDGTNQTSSDVTVNLKPGEGGLISRTLEAGHYEYSGWHDQYDTTYYRNLDAVYGTVTVNVWHQATDMDQPGYYESVDVNVITGLRENVYLAGGEFYYSNNVFSLSDSVPWAGAYNWNDGILNYIYGQGFTADSQYSGWMDTLVNAYAQAAQAMQQANTYTADNPTPITVGAHYDTQTWQADKYTYTNPAFVTTEYSPTVVYPSFKSTSPEELQHSYNAAYDNANEGRYAYNGITSPQTAETTQALTLKLNQGNALPAEPSWNINPALADSHALQIESMFSNANGNITNIMDALKGVVKNPTADQQGMLETIGALLADINKMEKGADGQVSPELKKAQDNLLQAVANILLAQGVPDLLGKGDVANVKAIFSDLDIQKNRIMLEYAKSTKPYYDNVLKDLAKNMEALQVNKLLDGNISREDLEKLPPSELDKILDKIRKMEKRSFEGDYVLQQEAKYRHDYLDPNKKKLEEDMKNMLDSFTGKIKGVLNNVEKK